MYPAPSRVRDLGERQRSYSPSFPHTLQWKMNQAIQAIFRVAIGGDYWGLGLGLSGLRALRQICNGFGILITCCDLWRLFGS
jgi:hypothetical protein